MPTGTFGYRRGIAPLLWVLVVLATLELVIVHVVLAIWWPHVALLVSLLTLAGVVWLVTGIASFEHRPVVVEPDRVLMRVGTIKSVELQRQAIAGVRLAGWTGKDIGERSMLNMALTAWPNVVVDLAHPLPGRRGIRAIAHRLDDPAGFAAALAPLSATHDH